MDISMPERSRGRRPDRWRLGLVVLSCAGCEARPKYSVGVVGSCQWHRGHIQGHGRGAIVRCSSPSFFQPVTHQWSMRHNSSNDLSRVNMTKYGPTGSRLAGDDAKTLVGQTGISFAPLWRRTQARRASATIAPIRVTASVANVLPTKLAVAPAARTEHHAEEGQRRCRRWTTASRRSIAGSCDENTPTSTATPPATAT